MATASTLDDFIDLAEQLLHDDNPAGRLVIELTDGVLSELLRDSAHQNDESCAYCRDDTIWPLLEQPELRSPCNIQETATILARLATELINNSHSSRPFQAVTRAFSR